MGFVFIDHIWRVAICVLLEQYNSMAQFLEIPQIDAIQSQVTAIKLLTYQHFVIIIFELPIN